jgi:hypothetical protein
MKAEVGFGYRRALEIAVVVLREPCAVYRSPLRKTRDYAAIVLERLLQSQRKADRNQKAKRRRNSEAQ